MGIFERIKRLFKGIISVFVSGMEEDNPEALLEAAKQEFREKMTQYNSALARLAGIAERLKIQIKNKAEKARVLEQRVMANYKAKNLELAGSLARELQELKTDLEHDSHELKDTESAYQANVRNTKISQKEFQEKINRLERQLSQIKVKEAQSEAAAALSGVAFNVGDMADTLKNVEDILNKKFEQTAGKVRVATDLADIDTVREKEAEHQALDSQALAEFLASKGVQVETPAIDSPEPAQKEIGPISKETQTQ